MDNKQQPPKLDIASKDVLGENLEKLKALFPSAVKEGKVDIEALRNLIGDIHEPHQEYYNFTWAGKSEAFKIIKERSNATLKPCKDNNESVDFDNTQNIFIEGDNLEVLKLLQKTYHNAIKMIYIDPPYNKDKDFIYPDRWSQGLNSYLEYAKLLDEAGNITSSNAAEESVKQGRKHSRWLTMMYPRLFLARNLLRDDGVIFISIDENEQASLKQVCDEIFGEENFIGQFIWKNRTTPNDAKSNFAPDHEYLLVYAKNGDALQFKGVEKDLSNYTNADNDPNGPWIADNPSAASGNCIFEIKNPHTDDVYTPPAGRYWAFSKTRISEWSESGKLVFPTEKGKSFLLKKYLSELKSEKKPLSSIIEGTLTSNGTKEMKALYGEGSPFKYPKPSKLIKLLIEQICDDNDTVMDFFAGSGTTAHAVMESNIKCKFLLVQLPEIVDEKEPAFAMGYKTISDITIDRIKRVGNAVLNRDKGFKVFKLDQSNFKQWDENIATTEQFELALESYEDKIRDEAKPLDMVYEVILAKGLSLNSKIDEIKIGSQIMYQVHSDDVSLLACFAKSITTQDIEEVASIQPDYFICSDSSFENNVALKTNAALALKEANIIFETL